MRFSFVVCTFFPIFADENVNPSLATLKERRNKKQTYSTLPPREATAQPQPLAANLFYKQNYSHGGASPLLKIYIIELLALVRCIRIPPTIQIQRKQVSEGSRPLGVDHCTCSLDGPLGGSLDVKQGKWFHALSIIQIDK